MHIHPSSPNSTFTIDSAATKIQAGYRGYRVRKQLAPSPSSTLTTGNSLNHKYLNNKTKNNLINKKMNNDKCLTTSSGGGSGAGGVVGHQTEIENESAKKIQAGVRGFLVRKKQKLAVDAATKIQAGFRGFKTRQELKKGTTK